MTDNSSFLIPKSSLKNYAVWARNELIEQVKQRAYQYGISEKGYGEENASVIGGRVLSADEKRQRNEFVQKIKASTFQQAVEEVAYTWFNRFVALRYMEVNDFLPTHVRVLSDSQGNFNPEILKDVLHLDLEGLDKGKVSELLNANKTEELYRYLLLTQCNALNAALPEMFEKLGGYTEMLLPNNILKADGVLGRLVSDIIPEDTWRDGVQIIGWLYQYYNTEPKQAVFDGLKKNVKITKDKIPAATQLFTPDWIVRYMVENSLGRLYVNSELGMRNEELTEKERIEEEKRIASKFGWKYYLPEAEQTPEVRQAIHNSSLLIHHWEDIRLMDCCMGSGHILVYAFDVLMQIYVSEGYAERDAAKLILEKNIYGLDIDRRAYQLAYFSLMMKARQYSRRILTQDIKPQVYCPGDYADGQEYGSLVRVETTPPADAGTPPKEGNLEEMPEPTKQGEQIALGQSYESKLNTWDFRRLLAQKYDVVVTNPPYMGGKGMTAKMSEYVQTNFPDSKSDLFAVFIERCGQLLKPTGYQAMITMESWMFLSSFEKLRKKLFSVQRIINLVHMPYLGKGSTSLGINFGTATFILSKAQVKNYMAQYDYICYYETDHEGIPLSFPIKNNRYKTASIESFAQIPGSPVAYWVSNQFVRNFVSGHEFTKIASAKAGLSTTDNDRFLRYWYEVQLSKIGFGYSSLEETKDGKFAFIPHPKGGSFRKWYGNNEYVVLWYRNGIAIRNAAIGASGGRIVGSEFYFMQGLTWTDLTSTGLLSVRYMGKGQIFNSSAPSCFCHNDNDIWYLIACLNSKPVQEYLKLLAPTFHFNAGPIEKLPIPYSYEKYKDINLLAMDNITLSMADWDAFETSWDFKRHPLVPIRNEELGIRNENSSLENNSSFLTLHSSFKAWEREAAERFDTLKANEEELNRIFIDIYGLQDELTPEVEDKDVTVRRADLGREVRSLISYAVGCMFGRYSLDCEGLAYAGGEWPVRNEELGMRNENSSFTTPNSSLSYIPDKDNIIPICDDDYFEDDITGKFIKWVKVVYGSDTLQENLRFIAYGLTAKPGSGVDDFDPSKIPNSSFIIRNYFLNGFYADHLKIYQKRPIYWLFDSGKKNGFKALCYLHRYSRDLLAKLRTDYVHEQQERYRTQLNHIASALNTAQGAERARLLKQQDKLSAQAKELSAYEEKVHHLADRNITIDLDDGVKKNYEIFADVLAKIG